MAIKTRSDLINRGVEKRI